MTALETHSTAWHAERATGIGGSDIPVLLGLSNYASPFSLWARKVGLIPPDDDPGVEMAERREAGLLMEPVIAKLFERRTGLRVAGEQMMIRRPDRPEFRATLDGLVVESAASELDAALGNLQIKFDARRPFDEVPLAMRAQCIWEAGVGGYERSWLAVMHSYNTFRVYEIPFDPLDWDHMVAKASEFWACVQSNTPPPLDGSDATAETIAAIWPTHVKNTTIDLSGLASAFDGLQELKAEQKRVTELVDAHQAVIAWHAQDAETITVHGVPRYTYRAQSRTGFDRDALEAAHPELDLDPFTTTTTFRVLRAVTPKKEKK